MRPKQKYEGVYAEKDLSEDTAAALAFSFGILLLLVLEVMLYTIARI